ncbi:CG15369, partial [Drosophila busckii]
LGGVEELSGAGLKEAEDTLNLSLTKLAAGEGPNYKLGKIISARKQVVSGFKYYYEVELVEGSKTKTCKVEIWSQPWMPNGVEVIFDCPDGKVTKKHNA